MNFVTMLLYSFFTVFVLLDTTNGLSDGLCSSSSSYNQSYEQSYQSSYSQAYYHSCGSWSWRTCTSYRDATRLSYRIAYRTRYRTTYSCCSGWSPSGWSSNCLPVCSQCLHEGVCFRPNLCNCQPGFAGNFCQLSSDTCPENNTVSNDPGKAGARVTWTKVRMDETNITSSHIPGDFFSLGSTIVTYRFVNATINSSCSFSIFVIDDESPAIKCPADIISVVETGSISTPVYLPPPHVVDNSDAETNIQQNYESGHEFNIGITEVQYIVYDKSGNNATCDFQVIVKAQCSENKQYTSVGLLTWQRSDVRTTVESEQRCPVNSEQGHYGLASRNCLPDHTLGAQWTDPIIRDCGRRVEIDEADVATIPITEYNVEEAAAILVNITSVGTTSHQMNIEAIGQAFTNIVNVGSSSPQVTEAVVKIVNNVLSSTNGSFQQDTQSASVTSAIIKVLERQIALTLGKEGNFRVIQSNIAVEAVTMNDTDGVNGLGFAILSNDTDESFAPDSVTKLRSDKRPPTKDVSCSIQLPSEIFDRKSNKTAINVNFIVYRKDVLFQSKRLSSGNEAIISGSVISAVVDGKGNSTFDKPAIIQILPAKAGDKLKPSLINSTVCVFWDFRQNNGIGDWSEEGCERVSTRGGRVTCHCYHLTNFAVLLFQNDPTIEPFNFSLDIFSKIGCAVVIAALCITLLIFVIVSRQQRMTSSRKILINLCTSMLGLYIVFLVGIDAQNGSEIGCLVVAALLHYFVLTTWFWMGVKARQMYVNLVTVLKEESWRFLVKAAVFAWGVPVIIVAVTVGVKRGHFTSNKYCFLSPGYVLYFALLLPVGIVILHNIVTSGLVMRGLLKSHVGGGITDKTKLLQISQQIQNVSVISILLGISLAFGFLAIEDAKRPFQLIFCVCNSLQGFMVFTLFCLRQDDVRKTVIGKCFTKQGDVSSRGTTELRLSEKKPTEPFSYQENAGYDVSGLPSVPPIANDPKSTQNNQQISKYAYAYDIGDNNTYDCVHDGDESIYDDVN